MATPQAKLFISPADYLAFERQSDERHEYDNGRISAMAGESLSHSRINVNVAGEFHARLKGKRCEALSPNMKVAVTGSRYFYPDLSVVCDEPLFHDDQRDVLLNPSVIIEVLSPSTEKRDLNEKQLYYLQIPSLTDYIVIAQDRPLVRHYTRHDDGQWLFNVINDLTQSLTIKSLACTLSLADIYDRIEFAPEAEAEPSNSP